MLSKLARFLKTDVSTLLADPDQRSPRHGR
jgi:hypothetical protein